MRNTYVFDESPVRLSISYNEAEHQVKLNRFKFDYPEVAERFDIVNGELLFLISETSQVHDHNWAVDFLESNLNDGRLTNGEGVALSSNFYASLFDLFSDAGKAYFETGNDFCAMEKVGAYDCRYNFRLTKAGLESEEDE